MTGPVILEEGDLRDVTEEIARHKAFFFDIEAMGEYRGVPHLSNVTWMSLATDGQAWVVPFGHPIGDRIIGQHSEPRILSNGKITNFKVDDYEPAPRQVTRDTAFEILRPLFMSEDIIKVAHGASYDLASLPKYLGAQVARPYECNIVLDWVLDENRHAYGLKQRTKQLWGVSYDDQNVGREVEKYPFSMVAKYAYLDSKYAWLQWRKNRPQIKREGLEQIYKLELDILEIMVQMRQRGARVDMDNLFSLRETLARDLDEAEQALYKAAGKRFNINSVPQKQQLLFGPKREGGQGLRGWKLTDAGKQRKERGRELSPADYSTDDEVLASFPENPLASALREYQDISKLLNTYVDSWLGVPTPDDQPWVTGKPTQVYDGRIHADFVQYGTKTGRFSCRAPNLQNVPRGDTEHGKMLRDAWISDPGGVLVTADYGQIELVMLAHFIGEGAMFEGFQQGIDPHTMTAALVFSKHVTQVTKDERQAAKAINFAVVYGAGPKKVASMIGQPVKRAMDILDTHQHEFPEIYAYKKAVIKAATRDGYLRTLLGRKRRIPELRYSDEGLRLYAERQAFNSLIQGSSADLMKLAMIRTNENLKGIPGAYIALTVHDELVLSAPENAAEETASALKDGMAGPGIQQLIDVPLKADVAIGARWGELK